MFATGLSLGLCIFPAALGGLKLRVYRFGVTAFRAGPLSSGFNSGICWIFCCFMRPSSGYRLGGLGK